jgi:hypothetical protein
MLDVVESQQVRVLQVKTLRDAAKLDIEIPSNQLDGHFLAGIGQCVIDFAKAAPTHATLDGVARQGARTARPGEF